MLSFASLAHAQTPEQFYSGKTIKLIVGSSAGGSYDASARLVAAHFAKHVPGMPTIVVQNKKGASGRVAASYIYNVAPKDGTVLGAISQTLVLAQLLGKKGVEYDARKLNWIGTPIDPISVIAVLDKAGVKTMQEAAGKEVIIGATSSAGTNFIYPALANAFFDSKFKIIAGYSGGNAVNLAMERGEVQGRGSFVWSFLKAEKPEWVKSGKVIPLGQMSLRKHPDLTNVPRFIDLAKSEDAKKVMHLMSLTAAFGRPIMAGPGVPKDRVKALRSAFDATTKDPGFLRDAKKLKFEISPISGAQLQDYAETMLASPTSLVGLMKAALDSKQAMKCHKFTDPKYCRKRRKKKKKK